jgi:signal transduction histidine kinase
VTDAATILIVDDDSVVRSLMRASLESDGFRVVEAADGMAAYRACRDQPLDMLIVDVMMPHMDGFQLCREIRGNANLAFLPILMATGLDDIDSITRAFDAGATDFIAKPIQWVMLNHRVRYMLRASQAFSELRDKRNAAEAANRAKTEFLGNMSHELRTPLNAIIGFAQMMHGGALGPLGDKYVDYARIIVESGEHLLAIINDVLDLAQAESNRLALAEETLEITSVVALCIDMIRNAADKAGVRYGVEVEAGLPTLRGDAAKLRQILINLLSNAVKFTPAGGSLTLSVTREPAGDIAFRVADTGTGIAADQMQRVLTPFHQADSRVARKHGGIGLGLPLTKRLIELHGGTLEIASRVGEGTVVTARFPRQRLSSGDDAITDAASD